MTDRQSQTLTDRLFEERETISIASCADCNGWTEPGERCATCARGNDTWPPTLESTFALVEVHGRRGRELSASLGEAEGKIASQLNEMISRHIGELTTLLDRLLDLDPCPVDAAALAAEHQVDVALEGGGA